ncbi:MAG TPA: Nramp family divalent metal transporter [Bacteroidales bacterium]|nr:Nramp family divalent metal transporter [Bacteroidales bacterium]HPF02578.1 Nramp family divalent metal transporter [Bacteroidales bacterium]HPJ59285.1 Nramp family divalent metal transporter [Bacteroidales bacterium]HPR11037.1 Nramp family divalent metal transporter [Bacteroidales bacterium]HRW84436.1 Nramp family divalent metal transporter [Bacteroidales bacterium]
MKSSLLKKAALALAAVGPGLFLIGYNIGTGSVTTMAKAGAEHGMTLTWALVLSCVFTYILMVAYGKTTLVTGNTALYNIKNNFRFGKPIAIYILIALITGEILALMGIFGIVADLLSEGSRLLFGGNGFSTLWITAVMVAALYALLWFGAYKTFEKFLIYLVIIMGVSFIAVFFMVRPDLNSIVKGLVPSVPDTPGSFRLIAAMAGTTCSAAVFIMRSTVVAEKGWNISHLKNEKKDSAVSASMMFFLSFVIMAVSAGTLHVMGMKLHNTVEMISLFEPLGGKVAAFILILGIAGAGISSIFPIILIAPWLISDYTGRERNIKSPMYRILGLAGILFGFGMQVIKTTPPLLMVGSQAFQALILPAVAIPVFILVNRKNIMGEHRAGTNMNIWLSLVIVFSLVTSWFAIADFF